MSTVEKLRSAFEAAGIAFIAENGGGVGVRFREPAAKRQTRDLNSKSSTATGPVILAGNSFPRRLAGAHGGPGVNSACKERLFA